MGDADSGDGSVSTIGDFIASCGMTNAQCFSIGENRGFAYGNNFILSRYVLVRDDFDFVHFLNPDTIVHPGAVSRLASFLSANTKAGVAGSRLENPDGSLRAYGFNFPTPIREFFRGARVPVVEKLFPWTSVHIKNLLETREVDWVSGASFMAPKRVIDRVGVMDDGYFLYFEEVDLMKRVRAAGYQVWHVAESCVVHLGGQSTGVDIANRPAPTPDFWFRSRSKFFRDQYGKGGLLAANILFLAGDVIYRIHRLLMLKPIVNPPHLWRDYFTHGFATARERK